MIYGWYSKKQVSLQRKIRKKPSYLYYKDLNNNIVEVSMVTNTKKNMCNFDDLQYIGELKEFYKISNTILI